MTTRATLGLKPERINLVLPRDLAAELREAAHERRLSVNAAIIAALEAWTQGAQRG